MTTRGLPTAAGLAAGYVADAAFGDPRRGHPVAMFGRAALALERGVWADSRVRGACYASAGVTAAKALGVAVRVSTARSALARAAATALVTWAVLGGRGLASEGETMARLLEDSASGGDLTAARSRLSHLCGRDARELDADGLARAATESIAENTSDAVVAPLLWGGIAGVPGMLAYRALNTLDAMVGHRSPRYRRFGWASARGDDLANVLPARFSATATAACAPLVGGRARDALRAWTRDSARHPSPNAGPVEASFAGALGVRLGGLNRYGDAVEDRGELGSGPAPGPEDLRRSVRLSRAVGLAALGGGCVAALLRGAVARQGVRR